MVKYLRTVLFVLLIFVVGSFSVLVGQEQNYTPKKGIEYIKAEDYKNAEFVYQHLLKKYPKDAAYNFYMGICLLYNKGDISQSIKMLNYARVKRVSRKVHFYLGRAHQLAFHFDEAVANLETYLKTARPTDKQLSDAKYYLELSKNAQRISSKIYELEVLAKSSTTKDNILDLYQPIEDVGKLYKNGDFFESGVNPNHVMFETERGDVVYFSMETSDEDTLSIFKMEKLLDGWGDSKSLGSPVNSEYNDAYPFMETDGLTFYFASDRPGGFGGYDIYKIFYDSETQEFLEPINMGVPFNSPEDDFMFVSDEYSEVAWFASNRETTGDTVLVYTVKWDGHQVRNMADDANQIADAGKLTVGGASSAGIQNNAINSNRDSQRTRKKSGLFSFALNDTLVYTDFDEFLDEEAKELYRLGYQLQLKKDSLSSLMKARRVDYSRVSNETERNDIVNEILLLENKVYSLEDQIQEKYLYARQKELNEIQNRINSGSYHAAVKQNSDAPKALNLEGVFIPEKYVFHSSDEFERYYAKQEDVYEALFSANDIVSLKYADSLYVWANILNLESSRLLEQSANVEEIEPIKLGNLLNGNKDEEPEEPTSNDMIKESKELKLLSNRIYHKALDKKYPIYYLKLKDVSRNLNEENSKDILLNAQQGNALYRESKDLLSGMAGLSLESYEKSGTLKKAGVEKQEKALRIYYNLDKEGLVSSEVTAVEETAGVVQKSYAELQKGEEAFVPEEKEVSEFVEEPVAEVVAEKELSSASVYKVQIGVFRNPPKKEALDNIPPVSKEVLEGRGLTKYFSGNYKTYKEAQNAIPSIVNAGFAGAFVVYFQDGKISAIPK
ncbi:PD40 domain-containing protein [Labilibacter marinus]|uniref:PD40 domain-containing protein n=1 Tax=Labilibacter marinus TaxID=1477105 RepID=UPI00094F6A66|nr:PD40 domain-containing protein [Labilibacter marinus]